MHYLRLLLALRKCFKRVLSRRYEVGASLEYEALVLLTM